MTPSDKSNSLSPFNTAELERLRAERSAIDAKSSELYTQERRVRRQLHAEAMLLMLEAVDPVPILRALGLTDPANRSEVHGLVWAVAQDVADLLTEYVMT